ncbi:MAG: long-chain fatty acid--CoA ligase [Candidatus Omnitrophica bacterium]|nr:long-chain fatty acid--CoA ligase [Candidatus Omnitrophota bacterium]
MIERLERKFERIKEKELIIRGSVSFKYGWLVERINYWTNYLASLGHKDGKVVFLEGDFSPNSIALLLSLIKLNNIIVPLTRVRDELRNKYMAIARPEVTVRFEAEDKVEVIDAGVISSNNYYDRLRERRHPGMIFFSSGSTGESKAAIHDLSLFMSKFNISNNAYRTLVFLLFDHIGGINTLLYTLHNEGTIVVPQSLTPDDVLAAVEKNKVELLPTTPTFLNLVLISEAYKRHDLSSLKLITYGTEPMLESTLRRFNEYFPAIKLKQTYGLSELGILHSRSKGPDSLWMEIGGEGYETRIVDGVLHIRTDSAMLGYLNAENPFSEDGWFNTGDIVDVDGKYLKILGRDSEIINVGGEKVYPAEVESVIKELENIEDAVVYGEKNPIVGNIVCAKIKLLVQEDLKNLTLRVKSHCSGRLDDYKVPVGITITEEQQFNKRFKKIRKQDKFPGK